MQAITYRPPDILHWFSTGSQEAIDSAKRRSKDFTKKAGESTVKENILKVAGVAAEFGRGAAADLVHRQAAETVYKLYEDEIDVRGPVSSFTIKYEMINEIKSHSKDKFTIEHDAGTLTVRPVAHLVSGKVRVPLGWIRNSIEVPFTMLLEELSARCGVEIEPA